MRKKAPLLCRLSIKLIGKSSPGFFNCGIGCLKSYWEKCSNCPEFYWNWLVDATAEIHDREVFDDKK